jgi:serine/threonine-protein kinase
MLTGRRAFAGDTATDTMAKIIGAEPEWHRLESRVPQRVRDLMAACLTKDPRHRLHDIADARIQIERALTEPVTSVPAVRSWRPAAVAATFAAGAAALVVWVLVRPPATSLSPVVRTVIPLRLTGTTGGGPATLDVHGYSMGPSLAISPDGQMVAYLVRVNGTGRLYVRRLDQLQATAVEGSGGATAALFAPDGQSLAFVRDGGMFRAALTGGAPTRIADGIVNPRGVDWCGDQVVFTRDVSTGLFKVSVGDGSPTRLTSLDFERREKSHRFPHLLPGCRDVLFTIGTSTTESWGDGDLAVASMETGEYRVVLHGGVHARYSPSGHIVYNRGGTLYAAAFDLQRLEVTGPPVPVVTEVMSNSGGGWGEFALADNGTLVYAPGRSKMAERQLVRIDRRGRTEPILATPQEFASFRLSPDGRRVAAHLFGGIGSIWLFDLDRGAATRWTTEWDNAAPIWDPTGREIVFASPRRSVFDLYRQRVDGGVPAERIVATDFTKVPTSWSPDGQIIAYHEQGNIFVLRLAAGSTPTPFVNSRATEHSAEFSPNGAWLAYVSDESGRPEVYVRRFPDDGSRHPASVDGGTNPVWRPDGKELFYRNGPKMMAVAITDARTMTLARPQLLYERRFGGWGDNRFDVTPDGRYFIDLDDTVAEQPPTELVVVQQFADELRRLAPVR